MKRLSLLLLVLCCAVFLPRTAGATDTFPVRQQAAPLKLNQIERLLDLQFEDHLLAAEITQRGLAFRVNAQIIEQLQRRGLGTQAKQALLFQEEQQAYAAFADKTSDAAKRLALGREFLRLYPHSEHLAKVQAALPELELEAFKASFQAFSQAPDLLKLSQLFESGQLLLRGRADSGAILLVRTYQAVASARGALGNFYQDLQRSQALTKAALQLLEATPPSDTPPALWQELREQYLGELYRAQALYLLRQAEAEPEQSLQLLDQALQVGQANVAKEAMTYWLRALARDSSFQKQAQALAQPDLPAADRQTICARLTEIREKLVEDYTRVVALSATASGRSLQDEANLALKKLLNSPRPCVEPAEVAEAKTPPAPSRRARKVKSDEPKLRNVFIRSKTAFLNATLLEAVLLKQPDFQSGAWRIVRNQKDADLLVEISLPFLTWNWTYEVTQPATATLVATGKVREALATQAVPRLAEQLSEVFKRLREQ
jgi:hypothetical protein